jgi:hypothetical protein
MRKMMIIAAAALMAAVSFDVPAQAATVVVRTGHHAYHRPYHKRCWVKTVRHRDRHGHIVVRKTRVCR